MHPARTFKWFPVTPAVLLGVAALLLWKASLLVLVLFAAVLFAILIDGLAALIVHRLPVSQNITRGVVVALLVLALGAFLMLAGPRFADQVSQLAERLPRAVARLNELLQAQSWGRLLQSTGIAGRFEPDAAQLLAGVTGVFSTAFEMVANVVVIFFIGLYLALQPDLYVQGMLRLVPARSRERGAAVLHALGRALSWWLVGRFASMAAVGVLTTIGLALIGMPLALVLGVIAGLFSFVPYIGPVASVIPAMLIGLTESPMMAGYALGLYALVQFVEGNFLTPMIQKSAVSLPPAVLLSAQFAMGVFFGLFGVLLATPLAVVIIVLVQMLYLQEFLGEPVRVLGEHGDGAGQE